ncbi:hypothetical protein MLD55_14145 [Alcanivorax sp. MM125-6]|nr:hypothetical protein [Alcanivorax sp. MM125-6]
MDLSAIATEISGTDMTVIGVAIMGVLVSIWAFRKAASMVGR